jgi:hypothetical protein
VGLGKKETSHLMLYLYLYKFNVRNYHQRMRIDAETAYTLLTQCDRYRDMWQQVIQSDEISESAVMINDSFQTLVDTVGFLVEPKTDKSQYLILIR